MQIKQIFINSLWFGVVPKLTIIITVIIMPLITPYLTATDYGILGIISSYSAIISSLSSLGLNMHLTNSYYEYKNKFYLIWGRILFLLIISGIVCSIILSVLLFWALPEMSSKYYIIIFLLASSPIILNSNLLLANHLYTLRSSPKKLVLPILFSNIIGISTSFILVKYFKMGFIGMLSSSATSSIIAFILFYKPLWIKEKITPIFDKSRKRIMDMIIIALPVIPHTLGFMFLSSSDRIIMNIYNIPTVEIGYYTIGYTMGDYITVITAALITALMPRIQELYRSSNLLKLKNIFIVSQGFTMILVFFFAIWMPEIFKILIRNPDLQKGCSIASLICFSNIIYPLYALLSTIIFIEKKTKKLLWLVFVPGIINIFLNILLIPLFGYKAAIYTTLFAYWILLLIPICLKYFSDLFLKIFPSKYVLLKLFIIFLSLLVISNIISIYSFVFKIFITLTLSIILLTYIDKKRSIFEF